MFLRLPSVFIFTLVSGTFIFAENSWNQWRGPWGNGHAPKGKYPTHWSENNNVRWKILLPGRGHSSPVCKDGIAWLTTAIETAATFQERELRIKESKLPGAAGLHYLSKVELYALQIDLNSGEILRKIKVFDVLKPQAIHRLNSYASPTPIWEGNHLFLHFGTFGNACVNTDSGKILWKNNDQNLHIHHENGPGSSPISFQDLLIFHLDGTDKQSVVALKKNDGKICWQTRRSGALRENPQTKKAYSTPVIADTKDGPVLISTAADWVYGYNPSSGLELWKINYGILGFSNVAKPIVLEDLFIISTGFMKGELHAYRLDGKKTPTLAWKLIKGAPKKPSPIVVGKFLYVINDGGVLTCMHAYTGEEIWRSRLDGEYSASPTLADGLLYFSNQTGLTTVIEPRDSFSKIAQNQLRSGGHMASFAPLEQGFLIRTDLALYRIESLTTQ